MAERFFMPFQRSRCWFTPELWCDLFDENSPDAMIKFICDIVPGTLTAVLRPEAQQDSTKQSVIYNSIRRAWGSRQVGFQCYRTDDEDWTLQKPCNACRNIRKAQVAIVDVNDNSPRAFSFLTLAAQSYETLEQVRMLAFNESVPQKEVILINNGRDQLAPHIKRVYTFINYAETDLFETMSKRVSASRVFTEESSIISIDLEELGIPDDTDNKKSDLEKEKESSGSPLIEKKEKLQDDTPSQTPQPEETQTEDPEHDIPILILNEEDMNEKDTEDPEKGLQEIVEKLEDIAKLDDSQILERVETLIGQHEYYRAVQILNAKTFGNPKWEHLRISRISQSLDMMSPSEVVRFFFETISPVRGKEFVLEWTSDEPPEGTLTIHDINLITHLKTSCVPLRIYSTLETKHIRTCYENLVSQVSSGVSEIPILLVSKSVDEMPVELQITTYRDYMPAGHFICLSLSHLKHHIIERTGLEYFREQIINHYREVHDLYDVRKVVYEDGEFFGRKETVKSLIHQISLGENFFISGLRRTGKTSLLRKLERINRSEDHLIVYVSFEKENIPQGDLKEVYFFLLYHIKKALYGKYPPERYSREKYPVLNFDQMEVFRFDLKIPFRKLQRHFIEDLTDLFSTLRHTKELHFQKLVLLLDEIERLLPDEYDPVNKDGIKGYLDFFSQVHALSNMRDAAISIGMVGFGPHLRTALKDYTHPFYDQIKEQPLSMLTREECDELVRDIGRRMQVFYATESLEKIFQATGGDPQITRYLCSEIFYERGRKRGWVEPVHVIQGMVKFLKDSSHVARIENMWTVFSQYFSEEGRLLETAARKTEDNAPLNMSQIEGLSLSFPDSCLENLCNYGLLRKLDKNRYVIGLGLLYHWLRKELPEQ